MSRLRRMLVTDRYFFVTCNLGRGRGALRDSDFTILAETIEAARKKYGFFLTAWVFLPDHWHGLVLPHPPLTISKLMGIIKGSSTRFVNLKRQESGRLWQTRFYDHVIRKVGDYHKCIEYIHSNPVKRGLVKGSEEWPWSSIHSYTGRSVVRLRVDEVNLPTDPDYRLC